MSTIQRKWAGFGILSVTILITTGQPAAAEVMRVVSPALSADSEGDSSKSVGRGPHKVQYLFPASDFADLTDSNRLLVALNFRSDIQQTQPVDWTFPNEQIWMSTTDKVALTTVFADNHGPDKTLVYDGAITYPLLASGPALGPRDFADGMRLQTPFFYDPSQGSLVVEQLVLETGVPFPSPTIDVISIDDNRFLLSDSLGGTLGTLLTEIPVMRFEFVPEPSSFVMAGLASVCLLGFRKNTERPQRLR